MSQFGGLKIQAKKGEKFGGLKIQKKPEKGLSNANAGKSIFGDDPLEHDDDDDEQEDNKLKRAEEFKDQKKLRAPNRTLVTNLDRSSLQARLAVNADLVAQSIRNSEITANYETQDTSLYAYDEVYDTMKAAERTVRAELQKDADGKSKYQKSLQESLKRRNEDRMIARDVLNKRDREDEGDEFADKEVFVTSAYKKQKAEVEQLKAKQKAKEEEEKKKDKKRQGLSTIYHKVLSQAEDTHQAAVRAAAIAAADAASISLKPAKKETTDEAAK
ncbi:coiled-coil domain-containing protein 55-domain containing protein [Lipomyces japonicus]|uniref:coiled-coil domain-containing protein 55-domain containing protein n=1 Tax=Lipomyces japonicus TaxID=56871 RepID=UPI0034CDAC7C